ncbi:MAG: chitinase, partial [Undibacterium sp.]
MSTESKRRLSPWRVLFAILIVTGLVYGTTLSFDHWRQTEELAPEYHPWFAAYVDVTSTPLYDFEQLGSTATSDIVLSFIVADRNDPCVPTWGTYYTLDKAAAALDLDRRIARLEQQGGRIAIAFGGALNSELALACQDQDALFDAYHSVIERYHIDTIDLDLENQNLKDTEAGSRRASVIARLQAEYRNTGKNLAVWLTLPVSPSGLTQEGTDSIAQMLSSGVDLAGVNLMTMDYGAGRAEGQTMLDASQKALIETHRQLGVLYQRAGINLNSVSLWRKVGATPMIGQNDFPDEVFTAEDAQAFNEFSRLQGIGRMSMWSANRDIPCGENYVDTKVVSDSCSGVKSPKFTFA